MTARTVVLAPLLTIAVLLVAGCATPFDIGAATRDILPREAAQRPEIAQGREVAWGGTIVNATNLTDSTQFEVVAYPLDHNNRPQSDAGPLGRFLIVHPGYLETADYAPGRLVTVAGTVTGTRSGKVGEAQYVYPVVAANRMHLWVPETQRHHQEPRIHFGIGIGIIR
jgi:outer membrane lipoprotein